MPTRAAATLNSQLKSPDGTRAEPVAVTTEQPHDWLASASQSEVRLVTPPQGHSTRMEGLCEGAAEGHRF